METYLTEMRIEETEKLLREVIATVDRFVFDFSLLKKAERKGATVRDHLLWMV